MMPILKQLSRRSWFWPAVGLVISTALAVAMAFGQQPTSHESEPDGIDTYIPLGYVLVPISVQNSETLDSVFGSHGIVDLYPLDANGQPSGRASLKAVKMLRAPKNPQQFGVLVKESLAPDLVRLGASFAVVLHNPARRGTTIERPTAPQKPVIIYEGDEP